jgi:uncharacterized membrane protein YkvA (DUF1232 family)
MVNEGGPVEASVHPRSDADTSSVSASSHDAAGSWPRHKLTAALRSLGKRYLALLVGKHRTFSNQVEQVPERMHRAARQTRLMLEAIEDFNSGAYEEIPWGSVALMSGALLYAVNPADVVPDALPFLGALDDIAIVTIAVRLVQRDLRRYCEYKGYPVDEYF